MPEISNEDVFLRLFRFFERLAPRLFLVLIVVSLFLALMHHGFWQYGRDPGNITASFFDLDSESTVGSWFASMQWFCISLAAAGAYLFEAVLKSEKRWRIWWLIFALVFLVASLDDASILHETVGELLKPQFAKNGMAVSAFQYFRESPWLLFYALPLGSFILISLVFLSRRFEGRKSSRRSLLLAGAGFALFIVALTIEFVQGMPFDRLLPIATQFNCDCKSFYAGSVLLEETMENLGSTCLFMSLFYYNLDLIAGRFSR